VFVSGGNDGSVGVVSLDGIGEELELEGASGVGDHAFEAVSTDGAATV